MFVYELNGCGFESRCSHLNYKLIAIDLTKQIELENPDVKQQINFKKIMKKIMQQCSLLLRKKKKPLLIFHKILQLLFDMYKNGNSKDCKFTE